MKAGTGTHDLHYVPFPRETGEMAKIDPPLLCDVAKNDRRTGTLR